MTAQPLKGFDASRAFEFDSATGRKDLRVLLVDDNKMMQQLAAAVLDLEGYQIDVADDGRQAVEAVRKTAYDVILMDIQMTVMDGVQATSQIRALPAPQCDVWIVAGTGSGMACSQSGWRAVGLDDYVAKPYHPDELLEKLSHIDQARPAHSGVELALA